MGLNESHIHQTSSSTQQSITPQINKKHFRFFEVIGRGGYGKIYNVIHIKQKQDYAIKKMSKKKIIEKKSLKNIINERNIQSVLDHPFINNLHYSFQDNDYIYFVMDNLIGGDLRYHLHRSIRFTEEQTKYFIACAILGLEYLHSNRIIHGDLKPENMVLDKRGRVILIDFGNAHYYHEDNANENSGTPGYLAPEVLNQMNHTAAIDYYALGVIAYEFMKGVRPFQGNNRKDLKEQILSKQIQLKIGELPPNWSCEAGEFINKLLKRKPSNRLGLRGAYEVKEDPWFNNFSWRNLYNGNMAPIFPSYIKRNSNYDYRHVNRIEIDENEKYEKLMSPHDLKNIFTSLRYFNRSKMDIEDEINKAKIINPHIDYEDQFHDDNLDDSNKTKTIIMEKTGIGLNYEQNATIKKLNNSMSSKVLLKEYKRSVSLSEKLHTNTKK